MPQHASKGKLVAVEDDLVLRLIQVVLDPACPPPRHAAFADFARHDIGDFEGWLDALRKRVEPILPSRVALVSDAASLTAALATAHAAVLESLPVGEAQLRSAPNLKVIYKFGTMTEGIDRRACAARGVDVRTVRRRANISVAEHTFALLLTMARRLDKAIGLVTPERLAEGGFQLASYDRQHTPGSNFGRVDATGLLAGSRLGILGLGEIGREVAGRATAFGMKAAYYQRNRVAAGLEERLGVTYAPLEELLVQSDFVTIHLPMNASTQGLLDARRLALMPAHACLVNTSRAQIVEQQALQDALLSKRLRTAAFDVLYSEPMQGDDPLLAIPNLLLTPHIGGGNRLNGFGDIAEIVEGINEVLKEKT